MTPATHLAGRVWTDLSAADWTVLVPLGSLEQHGPHLPLDTDVRIATAVADAAVSAIGAPSGTAGTFVAPAISYGASGEHEGFPGTISIGSAALESLLLEYGRSACRWAQRLVFVNGHGGNATALRDAAARLRYEGRDVAWFPCAFGGDAHAGRTETSLMLAMAPEAVREAQAAAGAREPIGALLGRLREGGVAAVSPNGVLGDPAGATAADGAAMVEALAAQLVAALTGWQVDDDARLR